MSVRRFTFATFRRHLLLAAAAVSFTLTAATSPAAAQNVVAMVNGSPITNYDIEQRTKLIQLSRQKTLSREEALDQLVDDQLKISEARRFTAEIDEADVKRAFASTAARAGMNAAQFTQLLNSRGVDVGTLKAWLKAQIARARLDRWKPSLPLMKIAN